MLDQEHDNTIKVKQWLASYPTINDFYALSPNRSFAHDETQYDSQYKIEPDDLSNGIGLLNILKTYNVDISSPAWEIGCGTGALTLGLAVNHNYPLFVASDMSSSFLRIVQQKLDNLPQKTDNIALAIYDSDNYFHPAPAQAFSLIVLRATLHHILKPELFIKQMSELLVPGGVLVFHEPCREGFVLLGLLTKLFEDYLTSLPFYKRWWQQLIGSYKTDIGCANITWQTVLNSARGDIDKTEMEDKHVFLPEQVMAWGQKYGMDVQFIPNKEFNEINAPDFCVHKFTMSYLKNCMSFNEKFVQRFEKFAAPYLDYINQLSKNNTAPAFWGIFICRKRN